MLEPETTDLVLRVVEEHTLIDATSNGKQFETALAHMWNEVREAAERR